MKKTEQKKKKQKKMVAAMHLKQSLFRLNNEKRLKQPNGFQKRKKIIVAMSGGVDSSVAAALLKKQGYDVIGVFMKFWAPRAGATRIFADSNADLREYNRCCAPEAEKRARLVAKKLGIPFYVFNLEKEFKKRIVDYFLKEHKAGRTPNPCVVCNKEIKFGLLLEKALKLGAGYIATGHYVRLRREFPISNFQFSNKSKIPIYKLLKAKDRDKDQSYFLWQLNQKQLKHVLFPIGDYTREEVEGLAKKFKLPFSGIKKSMEVCFIQTTVEDFLKKYIKNNPGKIIDNDGQAIGEHDGLWFYTIGQRKGIGLAAVKPYYVLNKNKKRNLLVVTQNKKDLFQKELITKNVNWISGKAPKFPLRISAKIRYRHELTPAVIKREGNKIKVVFQKSQRAITAGQSVVFYAPVRSSQAKEGKGEEVVGGGVII